MELKVFDFFTASGDPVEMATYTMSILEFMKAEHEHKEKKKIARELDLNELFKGLSFEDMMRMEQDKEDK